MGDHDRPRTALARPIGAGDSEAASLVDLARRPRMSSSALIAAEMRGPLLSTQFARWPAAASVISARDGCPAFADVSRIWVARWTLRRRKQWLRRSRADRS
jgi:hypothetical protein